MPEARNNRIAVVTAGGRNPQILINALAASFAQVTVLLEPPESKVLFFRRRARKLGWITVSGQLATMVVSKLGKRLTERRTREILAKYDVSDAGNIAVETIAIPSINSHEAIDRILAARPGLVFLVSCRMLSAGTLAAMPCPVVNFHAGINPRYRGLMGGYWARVNDDEANFGATVHLVDPGVDTGAVLYQTRMAPDRRDTIHTYPLLQTAASTGIVVQAARDALAGRLAPMVVEGPSRQWYHPTIWTWLRHGLARGIW